MAPTYQVCIFSSCNCGVFAHFSIECNCFIKRGGNLCHKISALSCSFIYTVGLSDSICKWRFVNNVHRQLVTACALAHGQWNCLVLNFCLCGIPHGAGVYNPSDPATMRMKGMTYFMLRYPFISAPFYCVPFHRTASTVYNVGPSALSNPCGW